MSGSERPTKQIAVSAVRGSVCHAAEFYGSCLCGALRHDGFSDRAPVVDMLPSLAGVSSPSARRRLRRTSTTVAPAPCH